MDPDTETFIDDLAAVGARQLAVLLHEYAVEDDDLAARLRLMAAVHKGRDAAMSAVNRGIRELVDGRGFYPWDQAATLAGRIDNLRRVTLDAFLDGSPETAVALLRSLVGSSGTVMTRVDDSSGRVGRAYAETISSWGASWVAVGASDHRKLAALVLHEIATDDYGVKQNVLTAFQEALGQAGLMELRQLIQAELDHEPGEYRRGVWFHALQDVADALGDVDGFIAMVQATDRAEWRAVEIAERLVAADRPAEALAWLDRVEPIGGSAARAPDVGIAALLALGQIDEAQRARWTEVTEHLRIEHFRTYLDGLPVVDHEAARQQAVAVAIGHGNANAALEFLIRLPDTSAAETLIVTRTRDIDGRAYALLKPLAEVLVDVYPLSATLLMRVLAEAILDAGNSPAYHHAARYICKAENLAGRVTDWRGHESHADFMARLRGTLRRKSAFWPALAAAEKQCPANSQVIRGPE